MAHKYYCTHCARELDQDRVLIDMEYALTISQEETDDTDKKENSQKFQILKFRTKVQEFHDLVAKGTPGDLGYIKFKLSIGELAAYLANERNLNDERIASLTLEDIDAYLEDRRKKEFGDENKNSNNAVSFGSGIGGFNAPFGGTAMNAAEAEEKPEEQYIPSEAIKALQDQITSAKNEALNERMLEEDLSLLRKRVGEDGCIHIELKCIETEADDKSKLLVGYEARRDGRHVLVESARRCCYCGAVVFNHAGEAAHQAVAFIGDQGSGKTSTILALTHYATHAAQGILPDDAIWGKSKSIDGIAYMDAVGVDPVLKEDLDWYEQGVAPEKTEAQQREDAYSSTFWIVNQWDQKFILTLIDLPGELCKKDGTIDGKRIKDEFPVAMASDAFVMCFDTLVAEGSKASDIISMTRSWANEFQKLRRKYKKDSVIRLPGDTTPELTDDCIAPMIVVFTKCKELEGEVAEGTVEKVRRFEADRVKDIYYLKEERGYIDLNPVYRRVGNDIRVYENLKNAYIARLRTSPYGFAAPKKSVYLEDNNANKNDDGSIKVPRPEHVAELMQWLLMITGCVPVPAKYVPNAQETERNYRLENVFVRGAQYRIWPPQGKVYEEKLNSAMCRAYLFENYSEQDCEIIQRWGGDSVPVPGFLDKIIEKIKRLTGK